MRDPAVALTPGGQRVKERVAVFGYYTRNLLVCLLSYDLR